MLHGLDELWVIMARFVLLQAILEARSLVAGFREELLRAIKVRWAFHRA